MATTNPSFMNGVPELLVLRLLRDGEMYGYEIVQAIRQETGEVVSLGEGVVYPVLHALDEAADPRGKSNKQTSGPRTFGSETVRLADAHAIFVALVFVVAERAHRTHAAQHLCGDIARTSQCVLHLFGNAAHEAARTTRRPQ